MNLLTGTGSIWTERTKGICCQASKKYGRHQPPLCLRDPGGKNIDGSIRAPLFISARIQRRLATIGLTVEASWKHQLTVGVLSLPVKGAGQSGAIKPTGNKTHVGLAPPVPNLIVDGSGWIGLGNYI